ncbi:MAG: hypothetical protein IIV06_06505 [Alistipes sp.]|nr:hypothetical protein [Alistipes sp.]
MKKAILLMATLCCFVACERDEMIDHDSFVNALTTEVLDDTDFDVYDEQWGWGIPEGGIFGWRGIICNPDGSSKYITTWAPTGLHEGVLCTSGRWTYDSQTRMFTIDTYRYGRRIEAKVIYYKYPRVILEGRNTDQKSYLVRWDCSFRKEGAQELLDSCTLFMDADE